MKHEIPAYRQAGETGSNFPVEPGEGGNLMVWIMDGPEKGTV